MKVILVANIGFTITNFRSELIQKFIDRGDTVKVICSKEDDFNNALLDLGIELIQVDMDRKGMNPFTDLKTCYQFSRIFKKEKPDLILNYTIKPVIFSSLAAHFSCKAKVASFITGLGYVFIGDGFKKKVLRSIVKLFYRTALSINFRVFFQNIDDQDLFVSNKMVHQDKTVLINGSGVNLNKFKSTTSTIKMDKSFAFVGRLLKDKGIGELIDAIRIIKKSYPDANFHLCGDTDNNPASFSKSDVANWIKEGLVTHTVFTDDVKRYLSNKEVFILPSYREGTPRSTLEAMAMGMPVITTDVPGCRETVKEGHNGLKVRVKDAVDLANAIETLINDPILRQKMGINSLELAQERYDVHKVNDSIFKGLDITF